MSPLQSLRVKLLNSIQTQAATIALMVLVLYCPFLYRCGAGEADSSSMVAGIYQAGLAGSLISHPLYYFHSGQPLYNVLFASLVRLTHINFDSLLLILNGLACISTAVAAGAMYLMCRNAMITLFASLLGMLTYVMAPYTFELATYAHPQTLSIALMLAGFCTWLMAVNLQLERGKRTYLLGALAVLLCAGGLLVRMDGIVLITILWGFAVLGFSNWRRFFLISLALPAIISILAIVLRTFLMKSTASTNSSFDLLDSLLKFLDTSVVTGLPRLMVSLGMGGVLILCLALGYAVMRSDWRAFWAALVAVVPVAIYTCQNAAVPRRFIHLFVAAGFAVAIALRSADREIPIVEARSSGVDKKAGRGSRKMHRKVKAQAVPDGHKAWHFRTSAVIAAILLTGNWLAWPALAQISKATGDPFPDSIFWNTLGEFFPKRHAEQQDYFCWSKEANKNLTSSLIAPHDIIGTWLHYGELMSGFCRNKIPVQVEQVPPKLKGRPTITRLTANGITHSFYSPPWDMPPGQQTPNVLLLDNYKQDVTYGLHNIKVMAAPLTLKYHIW